MAKKTNVMRARIIAVVMFSAFFSNVLPQDYPLKLPAGVCKLVSVANCFNTKTGHAFEVGKEVASLSGEYTFCTDQKIIRCCGGPSRIVLVLDASGSMCQEVTSCAGASNNDPTNKRISGAMGFVDDVARKCPECEIGVIVFTGVGNDSAGRGTILQTLPAIKLNDTAHIAALHDAINNARCGTILGKTQQAGRLAKRALTFTGMALDSAIKMADEGFDTLAAIGMQRHIILLTDGDWQKPTTSEIITAYTRAFPGRKLPMIHGVFISDSATHVAAGFPQYGLVTCDPAAGIQVPVDMSFLQQATQATGGMYFPGSTPQTIVATFDSLFMGIVGTRVFGRDTIAYGLVSVDFTNAKTGEKRVAQFRRDSSDTSNGRYLVQVPPLVLEYGRNFFFYSMVIQDTAKSRETIHDTFSVIRKTTAGTLTNPVFKTECNIDTVALSISCKTGSLPATEFDTVTMRVAPQDTNSFAPGNMVVRAFVPFPDDKDARTLALFHLDSSLANSAPNGKPGMGTPLYSGNAAFGSAISLSDFKIELAEDIRGDFTFECWIKPSTPYRTDFLFSGSGMFFALKLGYLSATIGNASIQVESVIDADVWQHVALARRDGIANIYVNGIPRTAGVSAPYTIVGGIFTISDDAVGTLDEVRMSTCVRTSEIQDLTVLQIPTAENLLWKINGVTSALPSASLPASMWQQTPQGQVKFQVTSLVPGPIIINFLDMLSSPSYVRSFNGEPIAFGTNGAAVRFVAREKGSAIAPGIKLFDVRGKLLNKNTEGNLRIKAFHYQGVYFVKYPNGKVERRMNVVR